MTKNSRDASGRIFYITAALFFIIDQITKLLIKANIPLGSSIDLISFSNSNLSLSFTHTRNTGIAFSLLKNMPLIPTVAAIMVIILMIYYKNKIAFDKASAIASGLILAGAWGNLFDRLAFGYVTDFINFHFWPVFNVADSSLTVGAVILFFYFSRKEKDKNKGKK